MREQSSMTPRLWPEPLRGGGALSLREEGPGTVGSITEPGEA